MQCQNGADEARCPVPPGQGGPLACENKNPPEKTCLDQAGALTCYKLVCGDGKTCANTQAECPLPQQCPTTAPVRCPAGSAKELQCVTNIESCYPTQQCPNAFLCSDQQCYDYICGQTCQMTPC
jgi:hypothetical protein